MSSNIVRMTLNGEIITKGFLDTIPREGETIRLDVVQPDGHTTRGVYYKVDKVVHEWWQYKDGTLHPESVEIVVKE